MFSNANVIEIQKQQFSSGLQPPPPPPPHSHISSWSNLCLFKPYWKILATDTEAKSRIFQLFFYYPRSGCSYLSERANSAACLLFILYLSSFYITSESVRHGFHVLNIYKFFLADFPPTHTSTATSGNDPLPSLTEQCPRREETFYWLLQMANQERARSDNKLE